MPNDDDQDDHDSAPAPDNTTRVTTIRSTRTADERRHCSFVRGSTKVVLSNKATATATANANKTDILEKESTSKSNKATSPTTTRTTTRCYHYHYYSITLNHHGSKMEIWV
mmetsp:Transcript_30898/g.34583  ORF Transcript_30898/g.34583 Transcript_30898/m.34583 type:complete len:111 (-) Transcript_30898:92-424(-)|eukprot:CAMPEP_0170865134 /NCGR_PEP_ID=MMETSP0734-20130129/21037_1 /TAXON_ID=186038 /ORGANISM="Fragilariopsis kerguelensis, Strain L26-C5" /LENGTH=110 /DNA_ID=CAMNT_0011241165 /DNA_START=1721 /DNA_END=2053 /DNA_ORIENTATION=-